jgi:hypothetical protein
MVKRREVKLAGKNGYWAIAQVLGENEDGKLWVGYRTHLGLYQEGEFDPSQLREVDAEITDELLQAATHKAVSHLRDELVLMFEDEVLEEAGEAVLQALRLHFNYPASENDSQK